MILKKHIELVKQQFNDFFYLKKKRENIYQVFIPIYHPDGDMIDIFISKLPDNKIRITDCGLTLMRLSYSYDIDTPNKEKIFNRILNESKLKNEEGNIYVDVDPEDLYYGILQFSQGVIKILNMKLFKREIIQSMFFEMLEEFIFNNLNKYHPQKNYYPLPGHEEYEVDFCFNHREKPIFLWGVSNKDNARLATICCQKFIAEKIKFSSIIVLKDIDVIGKKDLARLMNAADKQFPSLEDFQEYAIEYFERESQN